LHVLLYKGFEDKNPYEEGANITLAGIAYLRIKSEVYGFIRMTIYPNLSSRSYELHRGIWKTTWNTE